MSGRKQIKKPYTPAPAADPIQMLGRRLTIKEQRFADEYLLDLSKTKAAERIGYTKKSAWLMGKELYDLPQVQTYIEYMLTERRAKILSNQDRIIRELERIAFFDPRALLNADGTEKGLQDFNDDEVAALADIEFAGAPKIDKRYKKNKPQLLNGNGNGISTQRTRKDGKPNNKNGNGAPPVEQVRKAVIKKISRYNKMEALKALGAYHGLRLSAVEQYFKGAGEGGKSGVIEAVNFENILRNLNAVELAEFKRLLAKAANDGDAADSYADSRQSTVGEESRSIH
jgi:hypothetical protein